MSGGRAALALVPATCLSLLALCLFVIAGAGGEANAQTCSTGLDATSSGPVAADTGGRPVVFEGVSEPTGTQVVVPIRPSGPQADPSWSSEQIHNASTITNVARTRGLPPRAAVIAVATAMQESSLRDHGGGDRDSVGLFQQRPSQGWGSRTQILDPVFASDKFYDVLVKVPDWQTKPLTEVAQSVQRSAYGGAYAKWEQAAGALVSKTWGQHAVTSISTGCTSNGTADPAARFSTKNPRSPGQAIASARKAVHQTGWYRRCDNFVAQAYGYGSSGSDTANVHWERLVNSGLAHPGDNSPPTGALLFYDTGESAGHVALYLGNDMVASNDIGDTYKGEGSISIVHRKDLTSGTWRLRYRGWAQPGFPGAAGHSSI